VSDGKIIEEVAASKKIQTGTMKGQNSCFSMAKGC